MIKYIGRLNPEERQPLLALISTARAAAKLLHARLLLKADVNVESHCWTDAEIAAALETSASTVQRVRQAWVAQGMEAAWSRKRPTGRQYRTLDESQEAPLVAVAGSAPPEGRVRWTLKRP